MALADIDTEFGHSIRARGMDIMLGGTHISGGIDQAVSLLTAAEAHKFAQKTIIIMTDGKWSEGVNPKTSATATTRVF